jgi:uncharacterized protein (TIGR03067 family)
MFPLIPCLVLFAGPLLADDESEKDLKKMAGNWVAVSMQLNGKKQPEATIKAIRLTITGDKYNTVVGEEKDEGTLKIDATKTPKEMDITMSQGENKGKVILCIYELKGTSSRSATPSTAHRATTSPGEDGKSVIMLITYKRRQRASGKHARHDGKAASRAHICSSPAACTATSSSRWRMGSRAELRPEEREDDAVPVVNEPAFRLGHRWAEDGLTSGLVRGGPTAA